MTDLFPNTDLRLIDEIATTAGTPFYLYDASVLRGRLDALRAALPQVDFFYSLKSNPNLSVTRVLHVITEKLNIGGLSLLWTLVQLAQDPQLAADISAECHGNDPLTMRDADSPLALSTVKEGLRLFPELPFIYRITSEEVPIGDYVIPSGATVVFAPCCLSSTRWSFPNRPPLSLAGCVRR